MKSNLLGRLSKDRILDLNILQWIVPLFLAITALIFEFLEHSLENELRFDLAFISETIIFGLMGPIIVGFIIAWMRQLMEAERKVSAEVHTLNRDLESKVAERTALLAERNQQLDIANQQLKRVDEMKSEFVSLVSHELRTPLTALNGGLEIALHSPDALPPASRHILETMVNESNRLTQFVQTILDVSRLEAGRLTFNFGPVAVTPILYRAEEIVLGERRKVYWHIPAEIPPVWADEIHYEQIVRNLLRNADKYSPLQLPIEISVLVGEQELAIEVADHGIGIPPEAQGRIFEQFQRGQSGESAPPGWGLGLYFAKKLTEAQGGKLSLRSPIWLEPDAPGSAFTVSLPIAADAPEENDSA